MVKSFLKDSGVYAIGVILGRLVGFVMIPVYTRALSPADYGVVETITRLVDICGLVLGLGVTGALLRFYHAAGNAESRNRLIASTMTLMVLVTLVGWLILWPLGPTLGELAFGETFEPQYGRFVQWAIVEMLFTILITLPLTVFRAEGRPWLFTGFSLAQLVTALSANIYFVVHLELGVRGVVLAGAVTASLWGVVLAVVVLARSGLRPSVSWIRQVIAYGAPLVPASIGQFILHFSDRFFLTRFSTVDELGLYSLSFRFAMLVLVVVGVLENGFWPWVFRAAGGKHGDRHLADASAVMLGGTAAVAAGVILFTEPTIRLIADESFAGAAQYTALIAISYWFFTAQGPLSIGLRLAKRTAVLSAVTAVAAIVSLLLSVVLVPSFGAWGAVWARLLSFALLAVGVAIVGQRIHRVSQHWDVQFVSIVLLVMTALADLVIHLPFVPDIAARGVIWVVVTYILYRSVNGVLLTPIGLRSLVRRFVTSDARATAPKRGLLVGYYGAQNVGDDLMLQAISSWCGRQRINLTVVSEDEAVTRAQSGLPTVANAPLLLEWGWYDSWGRGKALRLIRAFLSHEIVIVGGGDLIRDDRGWRVFWYTMEKILLAHLIGRPVYLVNVGIGRPQKRWSRLVLGWALRRCRRIIVRDARSLQLARELGFDDVTVFAPDIVLTLAPTAPPFRAPRYIAVALRRGVAVASRFQFGEEQQAGLAQALDEIVERTGLEVRFVPFQIIPELDDDRTHHEVQRRMRHADRTYREPWTGDPSRILAMLAGAEVVLAMPLHAAVLAAAARVRTLLIAYDVKGDEFAAVVGRAAVPAASMADARMLADALLEAARAAPLEPPAGTAELWRSIELNVDATMDAADPGDLLAEAPAVA